MDITNFGKYLKWAREKINMSQQDLADAIDCALSTISRIETGRHYPSITIFKALEEIFEEFGIQYDEIYMEHIFKFKRARRELLNAIKNGRAEEIEKKLQKFKEYMDNPESEGELDCSKEDKQYYVLAHLISVRKQGLSVEQFLDEAIAIFEINKKFPKIEDISIIKLSNIEFEILYSIGRAHMIAGDKKTAEEIFRGLLANKTNDHSPYVHEKYMELSSALARLCLHRKDYETTSECLGYVFSKYISTTDTRMLFKSLFLQIELCETVGDKKGAMLTNAFLKATENLMSYMYSHYRMRGNNV